MLQNSLKLAFRKLAKQRDYTLLNVFGLALSVGCGILIFALLRHHSSFDMHHKNAARTMRVVMDVKTETSFPFSGTPLPMAQALRDECPIVEKTAMRVAEDMMLVSLEKPSGEKAKFKEENRFAWVEPSYFEILDLPLLRGDLAAMQEPGTALLSDNLARKYFGDDEAIGKTLRINNQTDLRVVGILRDLPKNTDYKHDFLASWATLKTLPEMAKDINSWGGAGGDDFCFALLKPGHDFAEMDAVMAAFRQNHPHPDMADLFQYKALPMLGMHFDTDYGFQMDKKFLWALGLIGVFLLITACVNFVNMATAQALTRGREVGVRKSLGSTRGQLFWQFMAETGLIVGASLVVGFLLARVGLPHLNTWLKEDLALTSTAGGALLVFLGILGVALTFLAGSYPGLMQARFNPVVSMRGGTSELPSKGHFSMRRILVTTQFVISQVLIIGAAVIAAQMRYARDVDWGFRPGAVLTLEVPETGPMKTLQAQLSQIAGVKSVSLCYQAPASAANDHTGVVYDKRPEPEQWIVNNKPADANYLETFGLKLVAGRNLVASDTVREFVVNETFLKKLNLSSPEEILNKTLQVGRSKGPIVGVVQDFHNWQISNAIAPIAFSTYSNDYKTCAVQLAPGNPAPALEQIKKTWESLYPNHFYEQHFMDDQLGKFMETETMLMRLVNTFAGIAIFIGCLGLYGLATFMVTRKRKEVGIRKTLGASVPGILWLFGKEYARLIVIAFVLAAPIAWWAMNTWLQDYAYRISIGAGVFAISLLTTVGIAALTVGLQSLRAALANPVQSLRSE